MLMSDTELKNRMDTIEASLPTVELTLESIDPFHDPSMDYQNGKLLDMDKQTGTLEIKVIHESITRLRRKRTAYDELNLQDALALLREIGNDMMTTASEGHPNVVPPSFGRHLTELHDAESVLANDLLERVKRLEGSHCIGRDSQ